MQDGADVVVVGGGIQGMATALHLLSAGVQNVRILERDGAFEATSTAGAGFVALWAAMTPRPYDLADADVARYGLTFYRDLAEQGHAIGYARNGLLYLGADDASVEHFGAIRRPDIDPDTVLVDAVQISELGSGAIDAAGLSGGLYQPSAAQVHTPLVGSALAKLVARAGGTLDVHRPVTGLLVEGGRVRGVDTARGPIASDTVVLAAGAWTNELIRPLGLRLPFVPLMASRMITEPVGLPSTLPAMMIFGAEPGGPVLWLRQQDGQLVWGGTYTSSPHDALVSLAQLPRNFNQMALDGIRDCQRVGVSAARFLPALGRYTSTTVAHGAPCYTPDYRALVGPAADVAGLYVLAGDNEAGVTHGPGFAKFIADLIVDGASKLADVDAWAVDRFGDTYPSDEDVLEGMLQLRRKTFPGS